MFCRFRETVKRRNGETAKRHDFSFFDILQNIAVWAAAQFFRRRLCRTEKTRACRTGSHTAAHSATCGTMLLFRLCRNKRVRLGAGQSGALTASPSDFAYLGRLCGGAKFAPKFPPKFAPKFEFIHRQAILPQKRGIVKRAANNSDVSLTKPISPSETIQQQRGRKTATTHQ